MKLLNKLITKTAIYKHLNDSYEQALRDVEALTSEKCERFTLRIPLDYNGNFREFEIYMKPNEIADMLKLWSEKYPKWYELEKLIKDKMNIIKQIKKIRTHVNKLDKKDENVKAIKQLIKEVL